MMEATPAAAAPLAIYRTELMLRQRIYWHATSVWKARGAIIDELDNDERGQRSN